MSRANSVLMEVLVVDIDGALCLSDWTTVHDQTMQHSGTKLPAALRPSADVPERVAGKLAVDDTLAGEPMVEVEFDAAFVTELKAAR